MEQIDEDPVKLSLILHDNFMDEEDREDRVDILASDRQGMDDLNNT